MVVSSSWPGRVLGLLGLALLLKQALPSPAPTTPTPTPEAFQQMEIRGQGALPLGGKVTLHFPEVAFDHQLSGEELQASAQGGWRALVRVPVGAVHVSLSVSAPGFQTYYSRTQSVGEILPECAPIPAPRLAPHLQPAALRPRPKPTSSPIPVRGVGPGQEIR